MYADRIQEAEYLLQIDYPYSLDTLKSAYRKRLQEVHPDHGGTADDFLNVQSAYQQLFSLFEDDPSAARTPIGYDAQQQQQQQTPTQSKANDIWTTSEDIQKDIQKRTASSKTTQNDDAFVYDNVDTKQKPSAAQRKQKKAQKVGTHRNPIRNSIYKVFKFLNKIPWFIVSWLTLTIYGIVDEFAKNQHGLNSIDSLFSNGLDMFMKIMVILIVFPIISYIVATAIHFVLSIIEEFARTDEPED